jgi:hypothetical protein
MHIQFTKNIQFTRLLKGEGRLREFNFRKVQDLTGISFSVDVCDDRGNRIMFYMKKDNDTWKIIPQPLPAWVLENEPGFHTLIEEELAHS